MLSQLNQQIQTESELISQLENSYPANSNSSAWHIHHTAVRDAYWRRRMLIAKKNGENQTETAKVY